ncbi:MAG: hypothetical protein ACHQVK_02735, partial [Candidatus Paceibacterales bacterium]
IIRNINFKNPFTILRLGLGLVFLANAWVAWFSPQEFQELITGSVILNHLPAISVSVMTIIIGINDSLLALIFLFNFKPAMKNALAWAMIWLIAVMLVILEPVDILEHLGFFSIALALFVNLKQSSQP